MKKIFALLMAVCLMASVLCVAAAATSAEETIEPIVMRVTGLKKDGTVYTPEKSEFTKLSEGWITAATYAKDSTWKNTNDIDRVVVDLLADWTAIKNSFGSGEGFSSDGSICIPKNTRFTINMNGHTINRAMSGWDYNGEVIWVREGVNLIINGGKQGDPIVEIGTDLGTTKTGTITGGNSGNGAGGIHIDDKANVTLNNVNIVGNIADDDNGAGVAIHNNSVLFMNGGSLANNVIDGKSSSEFFGGAIYAYHSIVELYRVQVRNNQGTKAACYGAAIYAKNSAVWMEECLFDGNGIKDEANKVYAAFSIVHGEDSGFLVKKTTFSNNGALCLKKTPIGNASFLWSRRSGLFLLEESQLVIEDGSSFKNNTVYTLIQVLGDSTVRGENSTFTDNTAVVLDSHEHTDDSYFKTCTFKNNYFSDTEIYKGDAYDFYISGNTFSFYDCYLGDSAFDSIQTVVFDDSEIPNGAENVGSIFGEGSLSTLLSLLALVSSIASIGVSVMLYKKKADHGATNSESEE